MVCACFVWNEDDEIRRSLSMILPNRIFVRRPAQCQLIIIVLLSRSRGIGTTVRAAALAASGFVPQKMQPTRSPAALSSSTGTSVPSSSTAAVNVHNSGMTRGGAAMK
jgi:hypothetical protein